MNSTSTRSPQKSRYRRRISTPIYEYGLHINILSSSEAPHNIVVHYDTWLPHHKNKVNLQGVCLSEKCGREDEVTDHGPQSNSILLYVSFLLNHTEFSKKQS